MKNQKWNMILLADEIAGIAYYFFWMNDLKVLVNQFGTFITTFSLMLASLLIGRIFNYLMDLAIQFYFRITHYYQKQVLGPSVAIEFMMVKKYMKESDVYTIFKKVEKQSIDYIFDHLIFIRELSRSFLFLCCFHAFDLIVAFSSIFDLFMIVGLLIVSLISSILFMRYDLLIKKECISYSYQQIEGGNIHEI